MKIFGVGKSKIEKESERLEYYRLKAQVAKAKADQRRHKNAEATSKFRANQRKLVQKIEEIDNLGELKDVLKEYLPDQEEKQDPMMILVDKFLSGGMNSPPITPQQQIPPDNFKVSDREKLIDEYMKEHPNQAKIIEKELSKYAKKKGYSDMKL